MTKQEVIDRLLPKAYELHALYGIQIPQTLAQVINESGWLKHAPGNNFLGIKVPKVTINGKVAKAGDNVSVGDRITLSFGSGQMNIEVVQVKDNAKKDEAHELYKSLD